MSDDATAAALAALNQTLRDLTKALRELRQSLGDEEKPRE